MRQLFWVTLRDCLTVSRRLQFWLRLRVRSFRQRQVRWLRPPFME